jgi:S-methylmethionine-dependent homocysteine/selenocysteine methylase
VTIREALHSGRPLLLDAAMGTELARRGADTRPPLWSARALASTPELVKAIHAENVAAGADVLTANTFRLHRRNIEREPETFLLQRETSSSDVRCQGSATAARRAERALDTGHPRDTFPAIGGCNGSRRTSEEMGTSLVRQLVTKAVGLAREAASETSSKRTGLARQIWVAGSLAPLEDCYRPDLVPDDSALVREHRVMAEVLAEAGCDLILVETMNAVRELLAATRAALATGLPVVASMVTDGAGRLLSGEPVGEAVRTLLALTPGPDAIGVNCVPSRLIGDDLARLRAAAPGAPLSVYANTGRALDEAAGLFTDPVTPEAYSRLAAGWLAGGSISLLGSCCGTTAAHTAALRPLV